MGVRSIPNKRSEYWIEKPEKGKGDYGIGLVLKNGSGEEQCIGFCLFDSDGNFRDSMHYKSNLSGSMKAKVERLQGRLCKKGEKSSESSWLYRENFPKFKEEKINFFISGDFAAFTKGTAKLLLVEYLKEYVEIFARRIKELTGWNKQQTTSCVVGSPGNC